MALIREIGIAVRIVIITLWLQSAGVAALIHWVRHALASDAHRLGPFRSAVLVVRFTAAVIVLHVVLISVRHAEPPLRLLPGSHLFPFVIVLKADCHADGRVALRPNFGAA
jgi:hypothetical protein